MSGANFVCLTSWICLCSTAIIFVQLPRRSSCRDKRRDCRRETHLCYSDIKKPIEPEATLALRIGCFSILGKSTAGHAPRNWSKTKIKTQQHVLKRGMKTVRERSDVFGSSRGYWMQQRGVDNQLEKTILDNHNVQISGYRYVKEMFENLRLNCVSVLTRSMRRPTYWSRDYSSPQRRSRQFITRSNTKRTWLHRRISTSKSSRRCSINAETESGTINLNNECIL